MGHNFDELWQVQTKSCQLDTDTIDIITGEAYMRNYHMTGISFAYIKQDVREAYAYFFPGQECDQVTVLV